MCVFLSDFPTGPKKIKTVLLPSRSNKESDRIGLYKQLQKKCKHLSTFPNGSKLDLPQENNIL